MSGGKSVGLTGIFNPSSADGIHQGRSTAISAEFQLLHVLAKSGPAEIGWVLYIVERPRPVEDKDVKGELSRSFFPAVGWALRHGRRKSSDWNGDVGF